MTALQFFPGQAPMSLSTTDRGLLDLLPQGILVLDGQGRVLDANPAARRFLELPEPPGSLADLESQWVDAEGVPMGWVDLAPLRFLREEPVDPEEVVGLRAPDGAVRWLGLTVAPLEQGQVLTTLVDMTRRIQRERVLHQSSEHFRAMVFNAPIAVGVSTLDGKIEYLNHAFITLFGYDQLDIPHLDTWWNLALPDLDLRREAMSAWFSAAREAIAQGTLIPPMTFPMRCKDGCIRQIELQAACTGEHWLVIFSDLTERRRSEEALRESEARFRAIFEAEPECVKLVGQDGTLLAMNPAGLAMLEVDSPDDAIGKPITTWVARPYQVGFQQLARRVFAGETQQSVFEMIGERGTRRWMETHAGPWRNAAGEVEALLAVTRDITARKLAEDALRESERFLLEAQEAGQVGTYAWDIRLDAWASSPVLDRILGIDEAYPRNLEGWNHLVHPSFRERMGAYVAGLLASRDPFDLDYPIVRPSDGSDRWMHGRGVIERDSEGRPLRLVGTIQDITERREAQAALLASEARLRSITANAPDFILQLDRHGHILYINRTIPGLEPKDVLGQHWLGWISESDHPVAQRAFDRALECGEPQEYESLGRGPDGSLAHYLVKVAPVRGSDGMESLILIARDITADRSAQAERQKLEREIEHLQRLESVGRLAGGIAHDMNNVLAAIMSVGSLVRDRHAADADTVRQTDTLLQAAARGRDLVKGLMDFARKDIQDAETLDLNELVKREAELLGSTTFKKVQVVLDLAEGPARVRGEASALANVLMNLCVNACDAMPGGGTLTLRTRVFGNEVALEVEDTGEGMTEEVRARALEPFFTTKPAGKGTGLGLSIVYGTVKAHGGQMELASAPGRGTRFSIRFPAGVEEPQSQNVAPVGNPAGRARRILVVDDDPLIRETLPAMLEVLGHVVRAAASGAEGLALLAQDASTDLMVLDLNMPEMDGLETLQRLRQFRPSLSVLISTGFKGEDVTEALAKDPHVSVLMKPFSLAEIRKAIGALP